MFPFWLRGIFGLMISIYIKFLIVVDANLKEVPFSCNHRVGNVIFLETMSCDLCYPLLNRNGRGLCGWNEEWGPFILGKGCGFP